MNKLTIDGRKRIENSTRILYQIYIRSESPPFQTHCLSPFPPPTRETFSSTDSSEFRCLRREYRSDYTKRVFGRAIEVEGEVTRRTSRTEWNKSRDCTALESLARRTCVNIKKREGSCCCFSSPRWSIGVRSKEEASSPLLPSPDV